MHYNFRMKRHIKQKNDNENDKNDKKKLINSAAVTGSLSRYSTTGISLTSKQECLVILPKTSEDTVVISL